MATPKFTIYDVNQQPVGGDDILDDALRLTAAKQGGYITDRDGNVVYAAGAGAFPVNSMEREQQNG